MGIHTLVALRPTLCSKFGLCVAFRPILRDYNLSRSHRVLVLIREPAVTTINSLDIKGCTPSRIRQTAHLHSHPTQTPAIRHTIGTGPAVLHSCYRKSGTHVRSHQQNNVGAA